LKVCLYCARKTGEVIKTRPLGVAYLASFLLNENIVEEDEIVIVDSIKEALDFKPDLLGVSSVSQVADDAVFFAKSCKEATGCVTVLGGYHITGIPSLLPDVFDIGVLGEGEVTFSAVVKHIGRVNDFSHGLRDINGICFHEDGKVFITDKREIIADIDSLPLPYRHKRYSGEEPLFTSRGCPYRCIFCASHTFWGDSYRVRSVDSVVDEIEYIVDNFNPKTINILDDLWVANKKRFRGIVDKLVALGITKKVSFKGFVRSNIIFEEDILLLKKLNYSSIRFGAETGSQKLLQRLKGKGISVSDHQNVIDLCEKQHMKCYASFMFGVPGETREDLEQTVGFLRRNKGKIGIAGFYFFNPIPGTVLWDYLEDKILGMKEFNLGRLQIDLNDNFRWDGVPYFNGDNVPLGEFKEIVDSIRAEFIVGGLFKRFKVFFYGLYVCLADYFGGVVWSFKLKAIGGK